MIDMRPEILSLGFVNFHETCQCISKASFKDARKNIFCKELLRLSEFYLTIDPSKLDHNQIKLLKNHLDFFWQWALALDARNGYTLSHEMRVTMDNLCSHWVPDYNKYIFAATDGDFAINRYSSSWDVLMGLFEKLYHLKFSYQLVFFTVPKSLFNDFLFVSIIYHEMGHFVDSYYNISDEVSRRIKIRLLDPAEEVRIRKEFIPILQSLYDENQGVYNDVKKRDDCIDSHIREFIADLFGAQYVGPHIMNHIELNRHGSYIVDHDSHPSPNARASLIDAFLKNDRTNLLLVDILDSFKDTGLELKDRYVRPSDAASLERGEPMTIDNDDELHSLFQLGWEVFFKDANAMNIASGNKLGSMNKYEFYLKLNEAMRQSIRDYLG